MNFSYPFFLYLLPLALIPLIIHLISNIIIRTKPFPNIFILKALKQEARGVKKISDLILILIRTIIIILIVLSLSKPYISFGNMPSIIIFDVSASISPFKEKIEEISNKYPNVKKVYISDKIYENIPKEMLSTFNYELLNKFNLKDALVISDFQRTSFSSIGNYKKYKIGEISQNRAILYAKQKSETLIVKIKGKGTLEIYEDKKLVYLTYANDSIIKIPKLNVKEGFLKLTLLPLDSLEFDNYYYAFYEPSKVLKASIFANNIEYKIISSFLNTMFNVIEGDEIIFISQKNFPIRSILNDKSHIIVFFDNFNVPYEIKTNYIFNGVVIDSVMLFSGNVFYKINNITLIGVKVSDLLLNPKLALWFENFLNQIVGNYKVYYSSIGDRINFQNPITIKTPTGTKIKTNSILLNEVGFYVSEDEKIIICSNVNRNESINEYLDIESESLPRIRDISDILLFLLLIFIVIELFYINLFGKKF
jgi:hypothetical protein